MRRPTLPRLRRRAFLPFATALLAAAAHASSDGAAHAADSVTLEAGGGQSRPTPAIQPSAFEYQKLLARYEPNETLYLSAAVRLTHDFTAAAAPGTTLKSGSDWVWLFSLDASQEIGKHFTLGVGVNGSPSSTRSIASPLSYPQGGGTFVESNALMRAQSSSIGASADLEYDTFDEDAPPRALDGSVEVSLGFSDYASQQAMTRVDTPNGPSNVDQFNQSCATRTPLCSVVAQALADKSRPTLDQFRLGATLTGTLFERSELALDAAYYVYTTGTPDQVGYFQVPVSDARGQSLGAATYGAGLPLLPPRWSLRPELAHKVGESLSLRAYYQLTDYTSADYSGHTVGGKVQLALGKWRVYTSGSYRADVSSQETATTWTAGLGVTRTF